MNLSQLNKEEKMLVRASKLTSRKRERFVYYALKHPSVFIKVYNESGLDDETFCKQYKINKKVFVELKFICLLKGESK